MSARTNWRRIALHRIDDSTCELRTQPVVIRPRKVRTKILTGLALGKIPTQQSLNRIRNFIRRSSVTQWSSCPCKSADRTSDTEVKRVH
jgi:hypothetical protein